LSPAPCFIIRLTNKTHCFFSNDSSYVYIPSIIATPTKRWVSPELIESRQWCNIGIVWIVPLFFYYFMFRHMSCFVYFFFLLLCFVIVLYIIISFYPLYIQTLALTLLLMPMQCHHLESWYAHFSYASRGHQMTHMCFTGGSFIFHLYH